jgi:hypothetical protein
MKDKVFKIAMIHIEGSTSKESATKEEINGIKKLVDIASGKESKELPEIENTEDFYEAAEFLKMSKQDFHRIITDIFKNSDPFKLPTGLVGEIGEFLGETKGIGVLPNSFLQRFFFMEDLDKKMGQNKWEFFFKDKKRLEEFKKQKGI